MGRTLRLRLLGPVQVERDGAPLRGFESRKALALLCYLALHDAPLTRTHLADLFWPDKPEARGRGNLSRVLHNLSTLMPDCLHADRHTVQFRRSPTCWLDVEAFDQLAAQGDAESLAAAVELYRGDLMAGYYLDDCPDFETWLVVERERWHRRAVEVLETLAEGDDFEQSLRYARRLLELDPWREEAHRQVMTLLARTGQRSAALAQYQTCRQVLAEELGIEPSQGTTTLYQRIQAADSASAYDLPAPTSPLVGRDSELAEIARLLANPDCRLLTLVGPGGIGKTRIALQAAADQAGTGAFLEGVAFVSLGPVSGPEFIVSTVAEALHFPFSGSGDPKTQLLNYLRDKELLLVLDSFEHLLSPPEGGTTEGAALLAEIVAHAFDVKLLVTSRERLNLRGEWLLEIQGLDFPQPAFNPDPPSARVWTRVEDYSAVQLFLQCAQRVQSGFSLSEAKVYDVAHICWLVGGMPLAVELAAAWVRTLSLKAIAQEIEGGLEFLTAPLRDVPERHRSIRAVFEHSWRLLSDEERAAFRKLCVFRGGFHREAAHTVAGASLALLSALVDKSFLSHSPVGRYEIHELLRQYGKEKLATLPEEEAMIMDLHCSYYADFLHDREAHLKGGRQKDVMGEIRAEIENVRVAWTRAVAQGRIAEIGKCLEGLWLFYDARGWFQEGEYAFGRAADDLWGTDGRDELGEEKGIILGQILARQGWFCFRLGHNKKSREVLQKGLDILRTAKRDTRREMALSLAGLGAVGWLVGEYSEGEQASQESLALAQAVGDHWIIAYALTGLGLVAHSLGEFSKARQLHQKSLVLFQRSNNYREIGMQLMLLGRIAGTLKEYAEARRLLQESLRISREIKDQFVIAQSLNRLGIVARLTGEYAESIQWQQESLSAFKQAGDLWGAGVALRELGESTCALGQYQISKQYFWEALKTAVETNSVHLVLDTLLGVATLLTVGGQELGSATDPKERALELLTVVVHHPAIGKHHRDGAMRLLAELDAESPPYVAASAQEKGRPKNIEAVVTEVLEELRGAPEESLV